MSDYNAIYQKIKKFFSALLIGKDVHSKSEPILPLREKDACRTEPSIGFYFLSQRMFFMSKSIQFLRSEEALALMRSETDIITLRLLYQIRLISDTMAWLATNEKKSRPERYQADRLSFDSVAFGPP